MKVFIFMYNSSMENFHIMWKFLNELVSIYWKKKSVFISHMISYSWFHFFKKKIIFALYLCSCSTDSIFSHIIVCAHHLIITYMHKHKARDILEGLLSWEDGIILHLYNFMFSFSVNRFFVEMLLSELLYIYLESCILFVTRNLDFLHWEFSKR